MVDVVELAAGVMDLAEFLAAEVDKTSYRIVECKTGISRGSLENLIKRQNKRLPEIETLQKIAENYNLYLWQVVEMAGVSLNLPQSDDERTRRLASIAQKQRSMQLLVDRLLEVVPSHPEFVDGMLGYLEYELAKLGNVNPQ